MSGQDYALGGLLSLKQIRLHEFPVDATRKMTKFQVSTAVMEYLKRRYGSESGDSEPSAALSTRYRAKSRFEHPAYDSFMLLTILMSTAPPDYDSIDDLPLLPTQ